MQVFHPQNTGTNVELLKMLQEGLRPDGAPYPIEAEYPLVLGAGREAFSYCLGSEAKPVAHANLWPRRLKGGADDTELQIGLVGNVVTHAQHRGQGLARELLERLKQEAVLQGLKALVLWSDLNEFYQKCGFASCGEERRWLIRVPAQVKRGGVARVAVRTGADEELSRRLLDCRLDGFSTIERSGSEFAQLLRIPGVSLLTEPATGRAVEAFSIMGKGCDMIGVVHEWGAANAFALVEQVKLQGQLHGYSEVLLLTPSKLPDGWHEILHHQSVQANRHPMALAWCLDPLVQERLQESFIWGLDSI